MIIWQGFPAKFAGLGIVFACKIPKFLGECKCV